MTLNRRNFLKGIGATLALPYLESLAAPAAAAPVRMAVLYLLAGGAPELADAAKGGSDR